jgi:hypothetical protein
MKIKELRDVCGEATLVIHMVTMQLRRHEYETDVEELQHKLMLADAMLLKTEIKEHIGTLENILKICEAVKHNRYLEDWQRCSRRSSSPCEHACTSSERCDGFSDLEPHQAIASQLEELAPFTDELRSWVIAQLDLQRKRREALWGPDGLFGGVKRVMYTEQGPMDEQESADAIARLEAKEDAENESMGLRVDQYELNLERIRHLCAVKGDLQEIVAIIHDGLPPKIVQDILPS